MSVDHIPGNLFTQGLQVSGGLVADSLIVNGTSISSGSGVVISTDPANNSTTIVPSTSITYGLKSKNETQDQTISDQGNTLTAHTASIASLNAALDALYGGTAGSWVGIVGSAFLSGAQFMPKSGGTFTGDITLGTKNIPSVNDVKFSNALMGTSTSNVYCGNVICTSNVYGNGVNLDLTRVSNFGTINTGTVAIGNAGGTVNLNGTIGTSITVGGTTNKITGAQDITCTRDFVSSNALMTANVYCSNVIVPTGAFFIGNGSKLTGITASTDCTNVLNFGTVPTTGTLNVGTAMTSGLIKLGNTTASGPQVIINGGSSGVSVSAGSGGMLLNSTGPIRIGTAVDTSIDIGFSGGANQVKISGNSLLAIIPHAVSTSSTHTPLSTGLIQTCVIPLSSEQGPISLTSGAGVLPTVMFRVPFAWKIYGARAHCLSASTSGSVIMDVRSYAQSTAIGAATVNSTTGTSIFQPSPRLGIAANNYSSVGSAITNNGLLTTTPVSIADDSILGVFITSVGTNVLGLKWTLYYSL